MNSANYSLILPSNQNEVSKVEKLVERCANEHKFSEDLHGTLAIVITELVNNAIIHGNKCVEEKKVELNIDVFESHVAVSVLDEGEGFEKDNVANPLDLENLEKTGGRGIFIVETMMDKTSHSQTETGHLIQTQIARQA